MRNESPKKSNLSFISKAKHKADCLPRRSSVRNLIPSSLGARTSKCQAVRRPHVDDTAFTGQPSAKKFSGRLIQSETKRESLDEQTEQSDYDSEDESNPRKKLSNNNCTFCREEQESDSEPLLECRRCKAKYHISKCLRYKGELERNLRRGNKLICPRCILCAACDSYISDPANVECSLCCQAWHGACAPPGYHTTPDYDSPWFCSRCCRIKKIKELNSPKQEKQIVIQNPRTRKQKNEVREKLEFEVDMKELEVLCKQRDLNTDRSKQIISAEQQNPVLSAKNRKDRRRKSSGEYDYTKGHHGENHPMSVRTDVEMYEEAKREAYPPTPSTSTSSTTQYLHFGDGKACKTIYPSAFDEPLQSAPYIYACKFCLYSTACQEDMKAHWNQCIIWHPPGNEIYRDDNISFFEVEGAGQIEYCRNLCLLSKLFIASKTLYDEVETFNFYILCERTTEGFVIAGYFSKEHYPANNNNLSCLLVFPTHQKKGYGRLLIDMSYELSRIEHKVGHPEHPLSDLGILAYRGYWRSSILCYIREHRKSDRLDINDICLATRIWTQDIVNQLMVDHIITNEKGKFNIKIARRALKFPLCQFRRQQVNPTKLIWKPRRTRSPPLDPKKINTYTS